ncbi:MAG: thrombospondin type 3 repeat-containing protein, partial [Polyangiales bacterium]
MGAWVAACLGRTPAAAQELPLQHFSLAESGQDGFAVRRPDTLGHLRFSTRLGLDYAFNPLVFESSDPAAGGDFSVVRHHLLYHFNMALGLGEHVMLFAGLPTHWVMRGNGTIAGLSASGYGLADAFTGVRVRILGDSDDRFSLGAQGRLVLPTARWADDAATLAGEETVAGGLALLGELRFSRLFFNASVGTELRRNTTLAVAEASPELNYSLGVGMPFQVGLYELQARAELFGETSFASFFGREESGVEILVGPQLRGRRGFQGGLAVGPGFGRGRGIPDVRALLTMGWTAPADVNERPFQGQCQCSQPVPVGADADGDGVPDHQDYCVHVPAGPLPDSAHPGCPMDADQDGVPDAEDACPQQNAGDFPNPNKPGCPLPDADHDFVPEPPDACPDEPGVPSTDPARSGCPS